MHQLNISVAVIALATLSAAADSSASASQQRATAAPRRTVASVADYPVNSQADRKSYVVERTHRGTTVDIPEADVIKFCGDRDGCTLRIGMHNWDDTGRVASRDSLFYYNRRNRAWRSEWNDSAGTNSNNPTQHVFQAWACYFTDGRYNGWQDKGDTDPAFGLLSWNQYNADCFLTIID